MVQVVFSGGPLLRLHDRPPKAIPLHEKEAYNRMRYRRCACMLWQTCGTKVLKDRTLLRVKNWTKSRLSERLANCICIDVPRRSYSVHWSDISEISYDGVRLTDPVSDQQTDSESCYERILYEQYGQGYHVR